MKRLKRRRVRHLLSEFLKLRQQFAQSPVQAPANTLQSWLEPIVRMWRFSRRHGITDGPPTKTEIRSRRAYGFRNFENDHLRVLAQCGWNGQMDQVW